MNWQLWIAATGLLFTVSISAGTIIWRLADVRALLVNEITSLRQEIEKEIAVNKLSTVQEHELLRRELHEVVDRRSREYGECVSAVRVKVTQVELWIRDQLAFYALKEDFQRGQDQVLEALKHLGETVDRRFGTMEEKLDRRFGEGHV